MQIITPDNINSVSELHDKDVVVIDVSGGKVEYEIRTLNVFDHNDTYLRSEYRIILTSLHHMNTLFAPWGSGKVAMARVNDVLGYPVLLMPNIIARASDDLLRLLRAILKHHTSHEGQLPGTIYKHEDGTLFMLAKVGSGARMRLISLEDGHSTHIGNRYDDTSAFGSSRHRFKKVENAHLVVVDKTPDSVTGSIHITEVKKGMWVRHARPESADAVGLIVCNYEPRSSCIINNILYVVYGSDIVIQCPTAFTEVSYDGATWMKLRTGE